VEAMLLHTEQQNKFNWRIEMNRIIAPALIALAIAVSSAAQAAPQTNNDFAAKFFSDLSRNGN
jgi:ABC-type cobalamin transport system permease subunit